MKIVLTGGGTAGHVTPNLALLPALYGVGAQVYYIGSKKGVEAELARGAGLTYYGISSGKLRRSLSVGNIARNVADMFRVAAGVGGALKILRKIRPDVVFSKGGFVVVPVVIAARMLGIRVIAHESDMTPGIATRLVIPYAAHMCVSFPDTLQRVPAGKATLTGMPVRREILEGSREKGLEMCGFSQSGLPVLLVTGGSQGAAAVNTAVRDSLDELLGHFRVIHLCGRGNLAGVARAGYAEFEYIAEGLPHVYAAADIVLARAGAGTLFELLALAKPHLLVPLPRGVSRGDQEDNAASFAKQGFSAVLPESEITPARLLVDLRTLYDTRHEKTAAMANHGAGDAVAAVMQVLRG
jgi:UDP-N-acetylglucosamine--N-acetylmuramyl-(pentapeptide) pyrophosphoryl-undecaprenol N-acetylglucosamine transferase